jgi:hypothetical protein
MTSGWIGYADLGFTYDFADNTTARLSVVMEDHNATSGINYIGQGDNGGQNIAVDEAWIELRQFFSQNLTLKVGLQDFSKKLRDADTGSFYMDLGEASYSSGGKADATGFVFTYDSGNQWMLDLTFLTVQETASTSVDDITMLGAFFEYVFGEGQHLHANLAVVDGDEASITQVIDFGAGILWSNVADIAGLDPYAEFHILSGDSGRAVDADAEAFRLGARWRFENSSGNPWIDLSYWSITGDATSSAGDDEDYASAENVEDLLIIESADYGLNIRNNYTAIKLSAGMSTTLNVAGAPSSQDNLDLEVRIGIVELEEDNGATDDEWGTEVDIIATWHLNKSVDVFAAIAFLSGSDLLEANTSSDTDIEDDSTTMFLFGTEVGF